jgi:hypothetical protein
MGIKMPIMGIKSKSRASAVPMRTSVAETSRLQSKCCRLMKTTTSLRTSPGLRKQAEEVLEEGETLSEFVNSALNRSIEVRRSRQRFIARGLASSVHTKKTGKYISAENVIRKLAGRLAKARQHAK